MTAGYQPFAITKFETGEFQYYQSWISPDDAFNPLVNAYTFRGQLVKRPGIVIYGLTGVMDYENNSVVATGNGGSTYSGSFGFPVYPNDVTFTADTASGILSATDNGSGTIVGPLVGAGSLINYTTGVWNINTTATVAASIPIVASYRFTSYVAGIKLPIMMITEWINETTDLHKLVVANTRRAAVFNTATKLFDPISTFSQNFYIAQSGDTTTGAITLPFTNIAPYSVTVTSTDNTGAVLTITDVPTTSTVGAFTTDAGLNSAGTSAINYSTGVITITFTNFAGNAPATIAITASLQGDYFTGNNTNLFNYTNWMGELYFTNNKDRVTLYDGTNLSRPPFGTTLAHFQTLVNDITTTLDVKVFQNSLLFIRPTSVGNGFPDAQAIRWSAFNQPFNFATDVPGNGGTRSAPTGDWLQSATFLRNDIVCDYQDSCFLFKYSGTTGQLFTFIKINSTKSCNAPYGSVEYDISTTSMGAKGLCKCDGVNKDRYDVPEAIDIYEDIDEDNFGICQAKRFDLVQQTWMIYPSISRPSTITSCDKAIVYNWLEETWSQYQISLSCLGSGKAYQDTTWNVFGNNTWASLLGPWNSFLNQDLVPWMLGGDQNGYIYFLNDENSDFDNFDTRIDTTIVSKRWNPFIEQGQKAIYGYVDFYYKVDLNNFIVPPGDPPAQITLYLSWFANNSKAPAISRQKMILDAPPPGDSSGSNNQLYAWKRMYLNISGEFLQLQIQSSTLEEEQGQFTIIGMVLWAKPAGRLVPGVFL